MEAWRRGAQAPTDGPRVRDPLSVGDAAYRSSETGAGTPLAGG
jgi:hypothetical protein